MRIGQEEMNLSFRQRRDIVLETTPIRTELRADTADIVIDLLQPVRKECDCQRVQGGKREDGVLDLAARLQRLACVVELANGILRDWQEGSSSRVSSAGKVARLTRVTPSQSSSCLMRRENADCVTCRVSAAREKLDVAASAMKSSSHFSSIGSGPFQQRAIRQYGNRAVCLVRLERDLFPAALPLMQFLHSDCKT